MGACFYFTDPMRKAKKALKNNNCHQAKEFFILSQNKEIAFARKAAGKCSSISITTSVWFYRYLSNSEEDEKKRNRAREKLADIYFEELKNYEKAIELYSFLKAQMDVSPKKLFYSFRMAVSFFELGKWPASLKEISLLEGKVKNEASLKDSGFFIEKGNVDFLKARIFLMQRKYKKAETMFRKIQKTQPLYFKKNKLFFYLSFIYESRKEFYQAISELKNFESTSEFLSDKIERLKVRQKNQPGSF